MKRTHIISTKQDSTFIFFVLLFFVIFVIVQSGPKVYIQCVVTKPIFTLYLISWKIISLRLSTRTLSNSVKMLKDTGEVPELMRNTIRIT